jgi:hypothetical protein
MATPAEIRAHQEWLGFLQPVGLVVSPTALVSAQAQVDRNIAPEQETLKALVREDEGGDDGTRRVWLPDLPAFFSQFLGWEPGDLAGEPGGPEVPPTLDVSVPDYDDVLSPTYAVPQSEETGGWLLLVRAETAGTPLDKPLREERRWQASPQARFERLLRANNVAIGVLANRTQIRLVYAPPLESTGHLTFTIADLCTVAGRPLVSALLMLLGARRLFSGPVEHRLPAILKLSRRYQNEVSIELAEQVLAALNALLRGFRSANDVTSGSLLAKVLRENPDEVYGGLLTTLMRLVFVLYAEDRDLLPSDDMYQKHYAVATLFEQLRDDAARYPDTMEQRFGAWSRLLTLFRLVYDGGGHGAMRLPARHGRLFDPDAYPFLEGRAHRSHRVVGERVGGVPRVSDGIVYQVLKNLLLLQGERMSYRTLDVEQIGSVYEAMMGFSLRQAEGPSIALRPEHIVINLQELLEVAPEKRVAWVKEHASSEVRGTALRDAATIEALAGALERRVSPATPTPLRAGDMYLQPTDERRRSGSHYTPRTLTAPIVKTTLKPILDALGEHPTPEQILGLKVSDPAMGSGAFLVEACRHLGEVLAAAWRHHKATPPIPRDEDVLRHAQRTIAQRCLYGVDKNPFAVDLAKLSLWLATFAKEHPFTFLDHALKAGDSLVGLSREQVASLHWAPSKQMPLVRQLVDERVAAAMDLRSRIEAMADSDDTKEKERLLREADAALDDVRLIGDVVVASFFGKETQRDRDNLRVANAGVIELWLRGQTSRADVEEVAASLHEGEHPIEPFHWELEFPEVFLRKNGGFDAYVGNPPFAGKNTIAAGHRSGYLSWLLTIQIESHGNSDLVAHFFRRTFNLLRRGGAFGLIATNTIAQGDTRSTGLRWICTHGGTIYAARKRYKWPGRAAVVVSVVHVRRGEMAGPFDLDGRREGRITAFLFHRGGHENPATLASNSGGAFRGMEIGTRALILQASDPDYEMLCSIPDPRYPGARLVKPYIGGADILADAVLTPRRFVVDIDGLDADVISRHPTLQNFVRRVMPGESRPAFRRPSLLLRERICRQPRLLAIVRHTDTGAIQFLPGSVIPNEATVCFAAFSSAAFCTLQSRIHEVWYRFLGSSIKDDPRYTPSDCFETFPFPKSWDEAPALEAAGRAYEEFRAALMSRYDEGLTDIYNRFHDRDERDPDLLRLRQLHTSLDRAVLDAYEWTDIPTDCDFFPEFDVASEENADSPSESRNRYHWPDEVREEVLARLLELNRQRAEDQRLLALEEAKCLAKPRKKGGKKRSSEGGPSVLF